MVSLDSRKPAILLSQVSVLLVFLLFAVAGRAQVLEPALKQATTVDAALAAIGARAPEPSSFLLLDMPDVALAGKVKARLASELAGTSWLVLLRGRAGQPPQQVLPGQAPQPVLLGAWPFKAGAKARVSLELEVQATESFTLLAFTRGRWFAVERQLKLGLPPDAVRAAKEARARRVREITARPAIPAPAPVEASPVPALAASAAASGPLDGPLSSRPPFASGAASAPPPDLSVSVSAAASYAAAAASTAGDRHR